MTLPGLAAWWLVTAPPGDPLGPTTQNPDAVRDTACRIVEGSQFCAPPSPPQVDPNAGGGGLNILGLFMWVLLIAIVLGLTFVLVRYLADRSGANRRGRERTDDVDPDDDALVGTAVIDRTREPRGWRDEADSHSAAGRYRDALRCRYRALVGDLARRGLLDEIPGRTTGEERGELRVSAPNASPAFREAADLFDAAWYGWMPVDSSHDARFRQLEFDVLAAATPLAHRVPRAYEVGV